MDRVGRFENSDGQFSIWNVSWVARTLVIEPAKLFDANIFYPHQNTLTFSEHNLAAGIMAVPVYWATGNPYLALNVVFLVAHGAQRWRARYYLVRYLTRRSTRRTARRRLLRVLPVHLRADVAHPAAADSGATVQPARVPSDWPIGRPGARGLVLGLVVADRRPRLATTRSSRC